MSVGDCSDRDEWRGQLKAKAKEKRWEISEHELCVHWCAGKGLRSTGKE